MPIDEDYEAEFDSWLKRRCGKLPTCPMCNKNDHWRPGNPAVIPYHPAPLPEAFTLRQLPAAAAAVLVCKHCGFIALFAWDVLVKEGR